MSEISSAQIERAIVIIDKSRQTHISWVKFLESGNPWVPDPSHVGDIKHQQACISEYNFVIVVLRKFLSEALKDG